VTVSEKKLAFAPQGHSRMLRETYVKNHGLLTNISPYLSLMLAVRTQKYCSIICSVVLVVFGLLLIRLLMRGTFDTSITIYILQNNLYGHPPNIINNNTKCKEQAGICLYT
jgi:xanthine/uracil/vitamin C permease (AzgA family)